VNRIGVYKITFLSSQVVYAFPPAALLAKLGVQVVVIVPVWQQAEWWPFVCTLPTVRCGDLKQFVIAGEAVLGHLFGP
jgi:hypothetical protein